MANTLALCLVVRDDANFPQWLAHHRRLGVGAFYLFSHGCLKALPDRMPDKSLMRGDVYYQDS